MLIVSYAPNSAHKNKRFKRNSNLLSRKNLPTKI